MAEPSKISDAEFEKLLLEFLRKESGRKLMLQLLGIPANISEQLQVLSSERIN